MEIKVEIIVRPCGDYRAICVGLPGCIVCGSTEQDVKAKIQDYARAYLASLDLAASAKFRFIYFSAGAGNRSERT